MGEPAKNIVEIDSPFEIRDFFNLIKRHFALVLSIGFFFAGVSAAVSFFFLPKEFRATATIMPKPKGSADSLAGRLAVAIAPSAFTSKTDQEVTQLQELLKSRQLTNRVIEKVAKQLTEKGIPLPDPERWPLLHQSMLNNVFVLSVTTFNAEFAFLMVNGFLEALQNHLTEAAITQSKRASDFIRARIDDVKDSLDELEYRLMKMRTADKFDSSKILEKGKTIESQISRAQREYAVQAKVLETLSQQFEQAQIDSKREELMFVSIDPPIVPDQPVGPRKLLNTFMGFLAGIGFAILLVFARERW